MSTLQHPKYQTIGMTKNQEGSLISKEASVLWNMQIHGTAREIAANTPDIVIKYLKNKTWKLMDMEVQSGRNTTLKTTEKLFKYEDLDIETNRMWGIKPK